tara:strand:- start:254 stop:1024 length:771 start_codon:yes stop_codon:yes gene_type:complete
MSENWKQWTRRDGYIYLKSDEDYEKSKVKALAKQDSGYGHSMYNDENIALARNSQAIYCAKCYQYTYHTYSVGEDIHADYGEYEDMTMRDGIAVTGDGKEIPKELCANCGDFHPVTSWAGPTRFELGWGVTMPERVKALEWFYNEHSEDDVLYRYEVRWEREGMYHNAQKFHCLMRYQRHENGWHTDHYNSKLIFLGYNWNEANYIVSSHIHALADTGIITQQEIDYQMKKFDAKRDELCDENRRIIGMPMPGEEE